MRVAPVSASSLRRVAGEEAGGFGYAEFDGGAGEAV